MSAKIARNLHQTLLHRSALPQAISARFQQTSAGQPQNGIVLGWRPRKIAPL